MVEQNEWEQESNKILFLFFFFYPIMFVIWGLNHNNMNSCNSAWVLLFFSGHSSFGINEKLSGSFLLVDQNTTCTDINDVRKEIYINKEHHLQTGRLLHQMHAPKKEFDLDTRSLYFMFTLTRQQNPIQNSSPLSGKILEYVVIRI
jgi:hypothetical protein